MQTEWALIEGFGGTLHIWKGPEARTALRNTLMYKLIAVGDYDTLQTIKLLRSESCQHK